MERDPWLTEQADDFFEGDSAWEDVDSADADHAEQATAQRRSPWPRGDDLERLRDGAGRGLRRSWLAVAALVVVAAIILAVVLSGGGGTTPNGVPTDQTLPTVTTPTTQASQSPPAPAAPAPIVVPVPAGTTLSVGDSGPTVRTLQRALARVGHDPGAADGTFGPATETAVKAFQTDAGLTADGIVGPATARALVQAQRNAG
jgi:hypothetical protein